MEKGIRQSATTTQRGRTDNVFKIWQRPRKIAGNTGQSEKGKNVVAQESAKLKDNEFLH